jgi:hypothetical protein
MPRLKKLYSRLPVKIRSRFRSLLPRQWLRWQAHRNTDVYLISYPKSGRTWLRVMIGKAILLHFNLPDTEDNLLLNWDATNQQVQKEKLPRLRVIHEDRPMLKSPQELQTDKGAFHDKKVIFLARDPRAVIVSSYFEMKKRGRMFGANPYEARQAVFEGDLTEFIRRKEGGFETLLTYYNIWAQNRHIPKNFLLVRYEDLRRTPQAQLRLVLDFLDLQSVSQACIEEAVMFASFENMQKMEAEGKFQSEVLRPANPSDPESYKARQGKVKGYLDYLSEEDLQYLNQKMHSELNTLYGYT